MFLNAPVQCLWPVRALLGEGPLWSVRDQALYFVDIKGAVLHRLNLNSGARASWHLPLPTGWVIERRERPGFIAGTTSGFAELEIEPFRFRIIGNPEPHYPGNRFNDAKADRFGRIWAGSMDDAESEQCGSLWRLDPDLSWSCADGGYAVPNGPTFCPQGATVYHSDSAKRLIYRFVLEPDGRLHSKSIFVEFPPQWGFPDGMTTDCEGGVWVAHWDGGRISRFAPDGTCERTIALPVSRPTSCCFAGDRLDRLLVTSARVGCEDEELAGGLFEVDAGVRGFAPAQFGG